MTAATFSYNEAVKHMRRGSQVARSGTPTSVIRKNDIADTHWIGNTAYMATAADKAANDWTLVKQGIGIA